MSLHATTAVWERSTAAGSARLLLLAIADYADEEGIAWPGVRTLARRARFTERRVQQLLRQLQQDGHIARLPNPGRGRFDCYQVLCCAEEQGDRGLGVGGLGGRAGVTVHPLPAVDAAPPVTVHPLPAVDAAPPVTAHPLPAVDAAPPPDAAQTPPAPNPGRARAILQSVNLSAQRVQSSAQGVQEPAQGVQEPAQGAKSPAQRVQEPAQPPPDEAQQQTESTEQNSEGVKEFAIAVKELPAQAHSADKKVKRVGKRVQRAHKGAKTAAQTGESAPHTHEDPSMIHNHNQQPNRARAESPQQSYFRVVAWVLGWEVAALSEEQRGAVAQTVGILSRSGYNEQDVRRFWREIWLHDWRWTRRHEHPKPAQLRSEIFRLRAQATLAADSAEPADADSARPVAPTPDELSLIEKLKEANKRDKLSADSTIRERLDLSNLQRSGLGAAHG